MKKRNIILAIIGLLLISGGVVLWQAGKNDSQDINISGHFKELSLVEDYQIKETPEGILIENQKENLKFQTPQGWDTKISESASGGGEVVLSSPDLEINPNSPFFLLLDKGAVITSRVEKYLTTNPEGFTNADSIRQFISSYRKDSTQSEESGYKVIEVDSWFALEEIVEGNEKTGRIISVKIPIENKVYFFEITISSEDQEKYTEEFNQFLKTISIG